MRKRFQGIGKKAEKKKSAATCLRPTTLSCKEVGWLLTLPLPSSEHEAPVPKRRGRGKGEKEERKGKVHPAIRRDDRQLEKTTKKLCMFGEISKEGTSRDRARQPPACFVSVSLAFVLLVPFSPLPSPSLSASLPFASVIVGLRREGAGVDGQRSEMPCTRVANLCHKPQGPSLNG